MRSITSAVEGETQLPITKLHQAARDFASAGIPVFPCVAGGKTPATANGFKDATTDLGIIDAWWHDNPNYNLAVEPERAGWCVVDTDPKNGGDAAWAAVEGDKPETYTVETPSGGRHFYFEGSLPPSASKLAPGVDTRGRGSYVLVPPSVVDGKHYRVLHDRDFAAIPDWIADKINRHDEPRKAVVHDLDLPGSVSRARTRLVDCVGRGDVAIEGRGGNNRTYQLACELHDLGLSPEMARELLEDIWNPHCLPPWSAGELEVIIGNAANHSQNEAGAWAVPPAADVFGASLDKITAMLPQEERRSRFYFEDDEEQDLAPDPTWMIEGLIPDCATILVNGKSGDFKSFLALDIMLAIATGKETFGKVPVRVGPTFYGAHEGRNAIKKPRKRAWKAAREFGGKTDFFVAPAPYVSMPEQCEEFREQIRVRLRTPGCKPIGAIVLDTVAKCMIGLNENDARDCGILIAFVDSLRDEFCCPVIALHHFGKDESRGGRGSSALAAGFDTIIHVKRSPATKLVRVNVSQHKDAEEPDAPWCFEGRMIGASVAFFPITVREFDALSGDTNELNGRRVGEALKGLNAFGQENAVTSNVLASVLTQAVEGEDQESRAQRVAATTRALAPLSKTKLEAYAHRDGRELRWCLPSPD